MTETNEVYFHPTLLRHIAEGRNNEAKSMINQDLAKASDKFGSLLHYTAKFGSAEITQFLIELGSDVDSLGQCGKTPLAIAVDYKRIADIKVLLEAEANIYIGNVNGQSALQLAFHLRYYDIRIIKMFVNRLKNEVSSIEELVERLYDVGCNLEHAIYLEDIGLLKGLLQRGFDVNLKNRDGKTALHIAAEINDTEVANIIIEHKADVNALDKNKNGPLFYAARNRNLALIHILLNEGANPNTKSNFNEHTPLFELYVNGKKDEVKKIDECVKLLLQHGAIPQNALHSAPSILFDYALKHWESKAIFYITAQLAIIETIGTSNTELLARCNDVHSEIQRKKLAKKFRKYQKILKIAMFDKLLLIDLLTDSPYKLRYRVRNETFVLKVEELCSKLKMNELCPYYYDTLTLRIARAVRTVKLEDEAIIVICNIFQKNQNEGYIGAREIVGYLNEKDLEHLCQV